MVRNSPYKHGDGSSCWTKNCSRGNEFSANIVEKENFMGEWFDKSVTDDNGPVFVGDVIAPFEDFQEAVKNNEVMSQTHPDYPYTIFKYSQMTTYTKNWNTITSASRGLVINHETGEIVARPFSKFFNWNESTVPAELMKGPIVVAEKLDGSLGISMNTPDGLKITTAGGFSSPQADHANKIYNERYNGKWKPRKGTTYLWEIIYPENRIVVNYGDEDDIHLLGAVNIKTGKSIPLSELKEWKWKKATEHSDLTSLDEVIKSEDRMNHEGFIVHYVDTDARVKYKHDEYIRYHRIATGVNSRRIWEVLREDDSNWDNWIQDVPEEFEEYITSTKKDLETQYGEKEKEIYANYDKLVAALPADIDQKSFAKFVMSNKEYKPYSNFFFSLRNNGKLGPKNVKSIWDSLKPSADKSFWSMNNGVEDN